MLGTTNLVRVSGAARCPGRCSRNRSGRPWACPRVVFFPVGADSRPRTSALAAVERGELVEVDGTVVEALPKGIFRVEVPGGCQVLAHIAGPDRMRISRILSGDRVRVSLSPYDPGRGRIIDHHR